MFLDQTLYTSLIVVEKYVELTQRDAMGKIQILARDGPEKTPKPKMIQQLHIFHSHSTRKSL